MRTPKLILTLILTLSFTTLFAQANFGGTYTIDTAKTVFGQLPHYMAPASFQVAQQGKAVTITRNSLDQNGVSSAFAENFIGPDTVSNKTPTGQFRKAVLKWSADGNGFTINSVSVNPDGSAYLKTWETWSLSGNILTIDRDVEQGNGLKYSIKCVYTKAE
jgi:hypothetical protein